MRAHGASPGPSTDPITPDDAGRDPTRGIRRLSVLGFVGIVVGYVVVLVVATLFTRDLTLSTPGFTETSDVARQLVVRMAVPLAFVCVVISALRWWRPVLVDHLPVRRWVWIVPAAIVLTVIAATNYPGLAAKPASFVALLLLGSLMIGLAEELLFRGVGVTAFRVNGHSEGRVALWTTVIFSLAHAASLIGGPLQVLSTLGAGYLYYLVRRVTGTLLAAALVHGLWDFGVFSAGVVEDEVYGAVPIFLVVEVALLILLLALHRRIEPAAA